MTELSVLDASALLCLLKGERGAGRVISSLLRTWVRAVNLSEVYAKLTDAGGAEARIAQAIGGMHLRVEPLDDAQARAAGMLRLRTKSLGLSFGDHACLALAQHRGAIAFTTDRVSTELPDTLGVAVELIRGRSG